MHTLGGTRTYPCSLLSISREQRFLTFCGTSWLCTIFKLQCTLKGSTDWLQLNYLSIHPSIHLTIYLSIYPYIYVYTYLSPSLSNSLSLYLSLYIYIYIHTHAHTNPMNSCLVPPSAHASRGLVGAAARRARAGANKFSGHVKTWLE